MINITLILINKSKNQTTTNTSHCNKNITPRWLKLTHSPYCNISAGSPQLLETKQLTSYSDLILFLLSGKTCLTSGMIDIIYYAGGEVNILVITKTHLEILNNQPLDPIGMASIINHTLTGSEFFTRGKFSNRIQF